MTPGRKAIFFATIVTMLMGGCASQDRPEGFVERWLVAVGRGPTGDPERYASEEFTDAIVPPPRPASGLEIIEVGRGAVDGDLALVPYRIERKTGEEMVGTVELRRIAGKWRVEGLSAPGSLRVPSRGGERIGRASPVVWGSGAAMALLLVLVSVLLMYVTSGTSRAPRAAPLPPCAGGRSPPAPPS